MTASQPIHPFPARMAPEIALKASASLAPGSVVLDPMAGSGTVLRAAMAQGHQAYGFDMDPLAVLMARVWTTPINPEALRQAGIVLVRQAQALTASDLDLPWMDAETTKFVNYWFGARQQADLRRLSAVLHHSSGVIGDALRVALSGIIITKDSGASLARDVSHSRPHRVRLLSDFDVRREFERSVYRLARRLEEHPPNGNAEVRVGDARRLPEVATASVDAVITSPPYLNAIDYMRGHRLTLVWLGCRLADLRMIRGEAIGAERGSSPEANHALARTLRAGMGSLDALPKVRQRMVDRYVLDLHAMLAELWRMLKPGGRAVLVVGNSCLQGVFVHNACAATMAAEIVGFRLVDSAERELPPARRYLPPPASSMAAKLEKRMRTETVLAFERS